MVNPLIGAVLIGAVLGALVLFLVLRNNPKLQDKLLNITQRIEDEIESRTGKDI